MRSSQLEPDEPSDGAPSRPDESAGDPTVGPAAGNGRDDPAAEPATESGDEAAVPSERQSRLDRIFCNRDFRRLWNAQLVSALGDWIGLLAITSLAARIGAGNAAQAVGVVLMARVAPGFFLASIGGVLVDRWDRKKVMVVCDLGRAATLALLPFISTVWGLVLASLVLEVFTLMWSPAKEASVPNMVPESFLTNANSLSLAAAYGSFPIASGLFAFLAKAAEWMSHLPGLQFLNLNQEATGFYFDVLTFCFSAWMISRLNIPHLTGRQRAVTADGVEVGGGDGAARPRRRLLPKINWSEAYAEVKEGWHYIFLTPLVRGVIIGLGAALVGGGMLVPLGPIFSNVVLHAGLTTGFGLLTTALGLGMAAGVIGISILQNKLPKARVFELAMLGGGTFLMVAAAMSSLLPAALFVSGVGVSAGVTYVLGYTMLQESVSNELRGRIFSALYTFVRLCVLLAFAVGPLLVRPLDSLSRRLFDSHVGVGPFNLSVPGVRLALWVAGLIILSAWVFTMRSFRQDPTITHGQVTPVDADEVTVAGGRDG